MKVKIYIETYPSKLLPQVLTGAEAKTFKMKTAKTKGTWFYYETTKTVSQVAAAFAAGGYALEDFPSVTFERG